MKREPTTLQQLHWNHYSQVQLCMNIRHIHTQAPYPVDQESTSKNSYFNGWNKSSIIRFWENSGFWQQLFTSAANIFVRTKQKTRVSLTPTYTSICPTCSSTQFSQTLWFFCSTKTKLSLKSWPFQNYLNTSKPWSRIIAKQPCKYAKLTMQNHLSNWINLVIRLKNIPLAYLLPVKHQV